MTAGRDKFGVSQNWNTPPKYVKLIQDFFNNEIDLDPCSNDYSLIDAKNRFSLPTNGLLESWEYKNIYVNPPYGRSKESGSSIKNWIGRCAEANKMYNSEVLALIPVATNTAHWKQYIFQGANSVCFLYDTRLKFYLDGIEFKKGAPMACAVVYWGKNKDKFNEIFQFCGKVVYLGENK